MIHANLPFSCDSGPATTSTPPARSCAIISTRLSTPVVDHERRVARAEPLAFFFRDVPYREALGLVIRPFQDRATKALNWHTEMLLVPSCKGNGIVSALEENAADSGNSRH